MFKKKTEKTGVEGKKYWCKFWKNLEDIEKVVFLKELDSGDVLVKTANLSPRVRSRDSLIAEV